MDLKEIYHRPLTEADEKGIADGTQYIKKHKIQELMNELLTHIIYKQPENPQKAMIQLLRQAKQDEWGHCRLVSEFMRRDDIDSIFNSYDILNQKKISYALFVQALFAVGIPDPEKLLKERYPEIKETAMIEKKQFGMILSKEHKMFGYSYEFNPPKQ